MVNIGFETSQHQGPGIFLSRLKAALAERGCFDDQNPDVWIQLSFQPIPDWIQERRQAGQTRLMVRMDGAYCGRHTKLSFPTPILDDWYSAKVNRRKNKLIRENLLAADEIIFQSDFSYRLTQKFVTPTLPGQIIHNGIDLNTFKPQGTAFQEINPDTINMLMSHNFRPYHRLHDGFRILRQLQAHTEKPVHLYVLGEDDGKTFPAALAEARHLDLTEGKDFTMLGKIPYQDLAPVYRSCNFMLNLSYWDTCPNVVIEAMACGLPILGVDHGGVAELVGDQGGILVSEQIPFTYLDHQNPERMPKAPVDLYCEGAQVLLRSHKALGQQAREHAQMNYDISIIAQRYLEAATAIVPTFV